MKRTEQGFTLIELLIVVVIIGILASIAIPKFQSVRQKAYVAAMKSDLKNLATQQEVYYNTAYSFASTMTAVQSTSSDGVTITINEATGTGCAATATHAALSSAQCGIYHGNAAATGGSPATAQSIVGCAF